MSFSVADRRADGFVLPGFLRAGIADRLPDRLPLTGSVPTTARRPAPDARSRSSCRAGGRSGSPGSNELCTDFDSGRSGPARL
jgi:hypothetical protein